jgi:ABC-type uncharacterized transport system permease subunit
MLLKLLATAVIILYFLLTVLFSYRLVSGGKGLSKLSLLSFASIVLLMHAYLLYNNLYAGHALDISFYSVFSLIAWVIAVMLVSFAWQEPIENLAIGVLPIAAIAVLLRLVSDKVSLFSHNFTFMLDIHIVTSLVAYSLLSIAALQSIMLYVQDAQLHKKHATGGLIQTLPPLETMERLLFKMIGVGFVILTLSLATGFLFIEDLMSQHKTVFSSIAWLLYAVLLWGRWKFGWRGRTAIRWTIAGFIFLFLAYFGSKFVLQIILNKQ